MKGQSGNGTLLPLPASASTELCRFHHFCFHIPATNYRPLRRAVTRLSMKREVRGSNLGRSNRTRCCQRLATAATLIFLRNRGCIAWAQWRGDGTCKLVTHFGVIPRLSKYNERVDLIDEPNNFSISWQINAINNQKLCSVKYLLMRGKYSIVN